MNIDYTLPGQTPTPAPAEGPAAPPAGPQGQQQAAPDEVTLSRTEYASLLAQAALERARASAPQQPATTDDRVTRLENQLREERITNALAATLGAIPFVDAQARADALALVRMDLEFVAGPNGEPQVIHKPSGLPLSDVSRETFVKRFSRTVLNPNPGGSGSTLHTNRPDPDGGVGFSSWSGDINARLFQARQQGNQTLGTLSSLKPR